MKAIRDESIKKPSIKNYNCSNYRKLRKKEPPKVNFRLIPSAQITQKLINKKLFKRNPMFQAKLIRNHKSVMFRTK